MKVVKPEHDLNSEITGILYCKRCGAEVSGHPPEEGMSPVRCVGCQEHPVRCTCPKQTLNTP